MRTGAGGRADIAVRGNVAPARCSTTSAAIVHVAILRFARFYLRSNDPLGGREAGTARISANAAQDA